MPNTQTNPLRLEVVQLDFDFGSYELGAGECRELIRILRQRGDQPGGEVELACAYRLEMILDGSADVRSLCGATEAQLDAIAEAAWSLLQQVGPAACPERVLVLLDVLRARHVHE